MPNYQFCKNDVVRISSSANSDLAFRIGIVRDVNLTSSLVDFGNESSVIDNLYLTKIGTFNENGGI